jgi:NADH-quinone oxidoreductase subunit C
MDADTLVASLTDAVPGAGIERVPSRDLHTTFYVSRDHVEATARVLRDRPELGFACLVELTAVDFWPREPRFELVYILVSFANRQRLRMKVRLHGDQAQVATVSGVWPAANWLEREVWDMFGIEFAGHPNPRRLLMPEDWEGFPLRKDYPVQISMKPRSAEPLQVTEQEFRSTLEKDRLVRHE